MTGFNPTFESGDGIVISLADVVAGSREGVLRSLRRALEQAENDIAELEEALEDSKIAIERWRLELARANAQREAVELALKAAEKAFT